MDDAIYLKKKVQSKVQLWPDTHKKEMVTRPLIFTDATL